MKKKDELLLIDAHSLIHRAYHALPPLTDTAGNPSGALYGVASVLIKILSTKQPTHVIALFDRPEETFRKKLYTEYKAHRKKADDELIHQLQEAPHLFETFGITCMSKVGFEGDDLIGTCVSQFKKDHTIRILTGDLDALQLVEPGVVVETFKRGVGDVVVYDSKAVKERFSITPKQLPDYKALVGDSSDNIPGIQGIGPKTAAKILTTYQSIETLIKKNPEEYKDIVSQKEQLVLSKKLATIDTSVDIHIPQEDTALSFDKERVHSYFQEKKFTSLIPRLESVQKDTTPSEPITPQKGILYENVYITHSLKEDIKKEHTIPDNPFDISLATRLLGYTDTSYTVLRAIFTSSSHSHEEFLQQAYKKLSHTLAQQGLEYVYNDIELPIVPIIAHMEEKGMCVDIKKLKTVKKKIKKEVTLLHEKIDTITNRTINPNSPKQVKEFITSQYDIPLKSTAAGALEAYRNDIPFINTLLEYREVFKLYTTYIQGIEKDILNEKVFPIIHQIGAATGRFSYQNPNLQNIPQESSWSQEIRNIFIPSPSYTFISFDYSQIELRVLASITKDPGLVSAFKEGKDIHTLTAQKIFNTDTIDPSMRRLAKTLNFGMVYGMGARAFAQQSGLSTKEAKRFIKTYFKEFSSIKSWHEEIINTVRKEQKVTNPHGRIRFLPDIHSPQQHRAAAAEREAINMPIQSMAADIIKIAMKRVNDVLKKKYTDSARIVLSVHDELLLEVDKKNIDTGKESSIIKDSIEAMCTNMPLDIPLHVDVKLGDSWGEMS